MTSRVLHVTITIDLPDDREREPMVVDGNTVPPLEEAIASIVVRSIEERAGAGLEAAGMPFTSISHEWVDAS